MGGIKIFLILLFSTCVFTSKLNSCESDADCTEGLGLRNNICKNNVCQCHEDFYINPNTGHCARLHQRLGGPCGTTSDCERFISNTMCNVGSCSCAYGYEVNADFRSCSLILGNDCETNGDCKSNASGIHCHPESKTCQCPDNQFYLASVPRCSRIPDGVKQTCANNATCSAIANSYCMFSGGDNKGGVCKCNHGYLETQGGGACVKIEENECEENIDCIHLSSLAECHSGKCLCGNGEDAFLDPVKNYCYKIPTQIAQSIPYRCHTDEQCRNIPGAGCRHADWCLCKPNHVELSLTECALAIGKDCSEDSECSSLDENLVCGNNKCACASGYFFTNVRNRCEELSSGLASYCEANEHCVNYNNTKCVGNQCLCNEGLERIYVDSEQNYVCLPPFGLPSCERSTDCGNDHLQCVANREQTTKYCACKQQYAMEVDTATKEHVCELPINKSCGFAGIPKNICNDHMRDSYCKVLRDGPDWWDYLAVCTCDDLNGYDYNSQTQTCEKKTTWF